MDNISSEKSKTAVVCVYYRGEVVWESSSMGYAEAIDLVNSIEDDIYTFFVKEGIEMEYLFDYDEVEVEIE